MALHKKLDALARIAADVVVLPEAGATSKVFERIDRAATVRPTSGSATSRIRASE